jgi:UDP-N-acetylmuramate--alanine ligase
LKRAEFLGQLTAGRRSIAVAGTHGKTTTTAMIAWMLAALGQDPSFIIGGIAANLGSNAHAGRGPFFVIEADEYDRMFLGLQPEIEVVTNVEHDHPDCYPTPEDFYQAFLAFVQRLPAAGGVLLACADDPGAARLLEEAAARGYQSRSYGIRDQGAVNSDQGLGTRDQGSGFDYEGRNLARNEVGGFSFEFVKQSQLAGSESPVPNPESRIPISLPVPGRHNVRNALAALGVADLLGLSLQEAALALREFRGTGRRFEVLGDVAGITFVDDYAHHPTEIRATLAAARARYPGRRIWAVWQPHTYSRTRMFSADFARSFEDADRVVVTEIYAAREAAPVEGFSTRQVVEKMQHPAAHFAPDLTQAEEYLLAHLLPGDVLLVLSAGDADQINTHLMQALKIRGNPAIVRSK